MIRFTIPEALPGQNVLLRMHWAKRRDMRARVAWSIRAALLERGTGFLLGSPPIRRCRISLTRLCRKPLDPDNLPSSFKFVLDCLQPPSPRHPNGLGVIADDSAACLVESRYLQAPGVADREVPFRREAGDVCGVDAAKRTVPVPAQPTMIAGPVFGFGVGEFGG